MEIISPKTDFGIDKMPDSIYGVKLSSIQKERLSKGEQLFLENLELSGNRIVDGKVSFYLADNELKLKLLEKKPNLEIPQEILGYTLTEVDIEQLKNEKLVPIKIKDGLIYLQIDKELNRVVVKTDKDLGIPKEIGGYQLSDRDKELFANHQTLPPRVYLNPENNSYFIASIRRTEDGKGLEFLNYKSVERDQAKSLIEKFNSKDLVLENTTGVTNAINQVSTEKRSSQEVYNDFEKNVQSRNFSAVKDMTDKGFKTTQDQIEQLTVKYGYSSSDKESLQASVAIAKPKAKEQELSL